MSPILFGTKEEQERLLANPEYQRLSDRVMRQLHESLSGHASKPPVSADQPELRVRTGNGDQPQGVDEVNLICICGADEDSEHMPDCPLAYESL